MIVKIKFKTVDGESLMLFGDSYKVWERQFEEYVRVFSNKLHSIISVEKSRSKWIAWGGLKWCQSDYFQEKLNREGVQRWEPDNPNPRLYACMKFTENQKVQDYAADYLSRAKERSGV